MRREQARIASGGLSTCSQSCKTSACSGAGHTHAGVLLVLSLAYFVYLGRTGYSASVTIDARRLQPTVNT